MGPAVAEIEVIQDKVRKFRSWYDESQPTLRILKALSEAFPENDSITAKTLEIRDQSKVSFTGISRDNKAVFNLGDSLRALPQVQGLKVENVRGKSPLQFTVSFKWVEGGAQ